MPRFGVVGKGGTQEVENSTSEIAARFKRPVSCARMVRVATEPSVPLPLLIESADIWMQ